MPGATGLQACLPASHARKLWQSGLAQIGEGTTASQPGLQSSLLSGQTGAAEENLGQSDRAFILKYPVWDIGDGRATWKDQAKIYIQCKLCLQ